MAADLFEAVRVAEGKADIVLSEAQREALKLIKETETRCAEAERGVAREHRALYQSILEEKRNAMQSELSAEAQRERGDIEARMRGARARLPQASQCIAKRVLNNGDR